MNPHGEQRSAVEADGHLVKVYTPADPGRTVTEAAAEAGLEFAGARDPGLGELPWQTPAWAGGTARLRDRIGARARATEEPRYSPRVTG